MAELLNENEHMMCRYVYVRSYLTYDTYVDNLNLMTNEVGHKDEPDEDEDGDSDTEGRRQREA